MPPPPERVWGRQPRVWLAAALAVYLVLTALVIYTKAPWCDEAWYATPGWNLLTHGYPGTSALDPTSTSWKHVKLSGIDHRTYWAMPLDFLVEVPWYAVFGFSLFSVRALSAAWGLVALLAWYGILLAVSDDRRVALLAVLLLACDYFFVNRAGDGRMDMMSAALAALAALAWLHWRDRNWPVAVFAANAFAAAAVFTHPNGGVLAILGIASLAFWLDRKRLRLRDFAIAAIPYVVCFAAWGLYILQDPASFRAQFLSAAVARSEPFSIWGAVAAETGRYLRNFGFAPWDRLATRLYFVTPLAYAAAFVFCIGRRKIRMRPGYRALLTWAAAYFSYMLLFEGLKTYLYLIYIVPLLTALVAVALRQAASIPHPLVRVACALAVAVLLAVPLARTGRRIAADDYHRSYLPVANFLQKQRFNSVIASAELGFRLGFDGRVVDDILLGYRSGKLPDYIVVDDVRYRDNLLELRVEEPQAYEHAMALLQKEYRTVFDSRGYRIYAHSERLGSY